VRLVRRDGERDRAAEAVGQQVDPGGQSTSGMPQTLVRRPPFPLAALR
jgi:hypothetical protein